MKKPKVAADPAMYCPKVRIIPLGPGPNLMILVAPNIKPMINPTEVPIMAPIFNLSNVVRVGAPGGPWPTGMGGMINFRGEL